MEWPTEKEEQLMKKLCFEEASNKEIAQQLGCDVKYIHAKRSQLGITRDKIKAAKQSEPITPISHRDNTIDKAFDGLQKALLLAIAYDGTSEKDAKLYSCMAETVIGLKGVLTAARGRS